MDASLSVPHNIKTLVQGVREGDCDKVQQKLDQGISVETTDIDGNSLLHIAAANGHEDVVRLLAIKGASLDRQNLYGWTALMQASRHGHENVALHLLNKKANINIITTMGINCVTLAIYGGYSKMVDLLFENGATLDTSENVTFFTSSISVATMHGRDDSLRTLLRRGIPPDQFFKYTEWTPLMISALTGQVPMARLLVDKGSNPNFKNKKGKTALEIATDCEMREVRGYLDRKTTNKPERVADKTDSIITAVKEGDYQKVLGLLTSDGSQANKSSSDGATPLMYASITGQLSMIQLLIKHGADIDARDYENGWTALMQATYYGKTHAAILLIKCNANVHIPAHNGVTAFDMAMLINLTDTTLFRLLAEKAMQPKSSPNGDSPSVTQLTKAWGSGSGTSLLVDSQKTTNQTGTTPSKKRGDWLSKMTRSMKGMKLTKTFKNSIFPNKLSFEETLIASDEVDDNPSFNSNNGNKVTMGDPYSMTTPTTQFPKDKLGPIVPPFQTVTGVDKQTMETQRKASGSKTSMSNSLNSSGESSVSRSIVRPHKFLHHSPTSSGRYNSHNNANNSPHSSDGATSVKFTHLKGDFHSADRHSDTALTSLAKKQQRKHVSSSHSVDGAKSKIRSAMSAEQLTYNSQQAQRRSRRSSKAGSIASSHSTSSTLTPPQTPRGRRVADRFSDASSTRSSRVPPSVADEDLNDLSLILRKLSLEKYRPIFEHQEIDMEAFLTLTYGDLSELGITQELPRQQILQAISQINVKKDGSGDSKQENNRSQHKGNSSKAWS